MYSNTIISKVKQAGSLELAQGFQVGLNKKPNRMHLFMMRVCFGFKWIGNKNSVKQ